MVITLKHEALCLILWSNSKLQRMEKVKVIVESIESSHRTKLDTAGISKIENFVKLFEKKMQSVKFSSLKFKNTFSDWMNDKMEIKFSAAGAPCKPYSDLSTKYKKKNIGYTFYVLKY